MCNILGGGDREGEDEKEEDEQVKEFD